MFGSIVVGTDGSETAKEAVRQAIELAKSLGAELLLVSAYQPVSRVKDLVNTIQGTPLEPIVR